jgi:hypothetical protein
MSKTCMLGDEVSDEDAFVVHRWHLLTVFT